MNARKTFLAVMVAMGLASVAGAVQLDFWNHYELADSVAPYLKDRLEIGFRMSHFTFKDSKRTIIGEDGRTYGYTLGISTYRLKERQSHSLLPYVRYNFTPYVGFQLAWNRLEGVTRNINGDTLEEYSHSDGNAVLSGPELLLFGRYTFERISPYAGAGFVLFSGRFHEEPSWHAGGLRNMEMDDTIGYLLSAGASIRLHYAWSADLAFSYINARPDGRYWYGSNTSRAVEWEFPMDSLVAHVGLKYTF